MLAREIGFRVSYLRKNKLNMSQEEFGSLINMDRSAINKIENGKSNITICTLEKILQALNITSKEFFNF